MNESIRWDFRSSDISSQLDKLYKTRNFAKIKFSTTIKNNTFHFYWEEEEACYIIEVVSIEKNLVGMVSVGDDFSTAKQALIQACEMAEKDNFHLEFSPDMEEEDIPKIVTEISQSIVNVLKRDFALGLAQKRGQISMEGQDLRDQNPNQDYPTLSVYEEFSEFCKIGYDEEFGIFRVRFSQCPEVGIGISEKFEDAERVQRMIQKRLEFYEDKFQTDPLHNFSKSGRHYSSIELEKFREEICAFIFKMRNPKPKK